MKVLLLGEYSSLYKNLKEGLVELGYDASVASYGDGWKNIPRDIKLGSGTPGLRHALGRRLAPFLKIDQLSGYDVVQLINPFYFYNRALPNRWLLDRIAQRNGRMFLSAAGDDAFFWRKARRIMRYGPFDDFLKYDIKRDDFFMNSDRALRFNEWVAGRVSGIIPIMYEYEAAYRDHSGLCETVPIPINTSQIEYRENIPGNKLVVFHGLNRYGFKGTRHVEAAFDILRKRYPNDLELVIEGGMPLPDYLALMAKVNVVIDQTNSYSLGVNGIYALAMGKVVLGGAEPESLTALGVKESPVLNITPSADSIVSQVERLLERRANISDLGLRSRQFAERVHDYRRVAQRYVDIWKSK